MISTTVAATELNRRAVKTRYTHQCTAGAGASSTGATNQSSPVLNGQSAMIIDLNDIEAGSYKLVVYTFVSEKKADQPLNINGTWECEFSK